MPSTAAAGAKKRKRPAFSPPKPKAGKRGSTTSTSQFKARGATSNLQRSNRMSSSTSSDSDSTAESEPESTAQSTTPQPEPDYILAEVTHAEVADEQGPMIPSALIHTLLNYHFSDKDKTRISQEAKTVIAKYVDIFVREAIARSAFERQEKSAENGTKDLNGRGDDGWLEVEDLEKMAPQLVLDF